MPVLRAQEASGDWTGERINTILEVKESEVYVVVEAGYPWML
jgi:hypothetical protein